MSFWGVWLAKSRSWGGLSDSRRAGYPQDSVIRGSFPGINLPPLQVVKEQVVGAITAVDNSLKTKEKSPEAEG